MKTKCVHNDIFNKTCWDCANRLGEECEYTGREVYQDSEPCDNFDEEEEKEER